MENNYITLEQYEKEVEEQNKFLLNEIAKHNINFEIYKLRCLQYQSNLKRMKKTNIWVMSYLDHK